MSKTLKRDRSLTPAETRRVEFYHRCKKSLEERLLRPFPAVSRKDVYRIPTALPLVHFEWCFHPSSFEVGLHFEKKNSEENRKLLNSFRPMEGSLKAKLRDKRVVFDPDWPRDSKWARLYVWRPDKEITEDLEKWAVEKMRMLIKVLEPKLRMIMADPEETPRRRRRNEPPPPTPEAVDLAPPERVPTTSYRILRDTELARDVKALHRYECQIIGCSHPIKLPDGSSYAEAHHIQPLGRDHKGYDVEANILCVCPHHHAELDLGVIPIALANLRKIEGHTIAKKYVDYHNNIVRKRWQKSK